MNRSRLPIIVVLVVSLVAAGLTRQWASAERNSGPGAAYRATGSAALSRMNSYALALLLGGLRGPLVMFLWPSAEEQKIEKNLEDFDTKIEWIRLLQAEFDTVHIYQIWNKAYNISVQMASLNNKYRTILDAIDYARSIDAERPNNINILFATAQVFFDKLGMSTEKGYYSERIREDSQARNDMVRITLPAQRQVELTELLANTGFSMAKVHFSEPDAGQTVSVTLPKAITDVIRTKFSGSDIAYLDRPRLDTRHDVPGWKRIQLDPILDSGGNILPQYLIPTMSRPAGLDPASEWEDGSDLQFLKKYEPFPYGISPIALGFNYYKRAQILNTVMKQKPAQISEEVVGSRPAFAMKTWSEDEWARGRRAELEAFGKTIPVERLDMEQTTASVPLDATMPHPLRITEALFEYERAIRLVQDSLAEYERHLRNSKVNLTLYLQHEDDLRAENELVLGDLHYLQAMITPADRDAKRASSASHYSEALRQFETIVLEHYVPDDQVASLYPKGVTRANFREQKLSPEVVSRLFETFRATLPDKLNLYENGDIVEEYLHYIDRAKRRLINLK